MFGGLRSGEHATGHLVRRERARPLFTRAGVRLTGDTLRSGGLNRVRTGNTVWFRDRTSRACDLSRVSVNSSSAAQRPCNEHAEGSPPAAGHHAW